MIEYLSKIWAINIDLAVNEKLGTKFCVLSIQTKMTLLIYTLFLNDWTLVLKVYTWEKFLEKDRNHFSMFWLKREWMNLAYDHSSFIFPVSISYWFSKDRI